MPINCIKDVIDKFGYDTPIYVPNKDGGGMVCFFSKEVNSKGEETLLLYRNSTNKRETRDTVLVGFETGVSSGWKKAVRYEPPTPEQDMDDRDIL